MPPRTIAGRYLVDRAVGRGGMGTVWLCRDEMLGRQVAVKQVGAMPGETTSDVARALREARSSAALNHPHVVAIYDAVEDESGNWLVMEYVPSRTLAEIVAEEGPLDPARVAALGAQAAEGLAAAHARGTVHRDVKPSNLLVTDDDHVKLSDFGISRTHGDVELTRTGLVTGTPSYLSPEAARGENAGPASDVWALGATLWTAVEGVGPYADRENPLAVLNAIVSEPTPVPSHGGPLADPVTRMMDHDPAARPSMAAVAALLSEVHRDASAGPTAPVAAAPVAAAPLAPTPVAAEPVAAADDVPPATPGDERARRGRGGWLLAAVVLLVLLLGGVVWQLGRDDDTEPVAGTDTGSTPTPSATTSETPSPTPTADPSPTQPPETTAPPATTAPPSPDPTRTRSPSEPAPTGDAAAFASSYYAQLPGDPEAAYELLSPSYQQSTSFESYAGFWRTIDAVSVGSTSVAEDGTTVDVELTYTTDGSSQTETRRLFLDPAGDGFVIGDDEAV